MPENFLQIALRNELSTDSRDPESLSSWIEAYFLFEVTTQESSRKVQQRDLKYFLEFFLHETGGDKLVNWSPRLSKAFKTFLQSTLNQKGERRWNDRTVNRILAHMKTFSKWVHKLKPFPLDDPMRKIKLLSTESLLNIEKAITPTERRRILDACDLLLETGGLSKDRNRYRNKKRPVRENYRPYRNRAIIYTLIETGMRRTAVTKINLKDVNFERGEIRTEEKGSVEHYYQISKEGLSAIRDYIEKERERDIPAYNGNALYLPAITVKQNKSGRLHPKSINEIWKSICEEAGVSGKTPHSARHAMGRHIIDKTGNIAAVQRQLGHINAAYSMQYSRITNEELKKALDQR